MNKQIALKLKEHAEKVAKMYSDKDRAKNFNNEGFKVHSITPLSEYTASIVFEKSSGKRALSFAYWQETGQGGFWRDLFVKESHVIGMEKLRRLLAEIEEHNFSFNFEKLEAEVMTKHDLVDFV